ncbi:MAG: hypothetical protein V2I43_22125 [Parvularcula sp.]|nr:hypothetical protein [Parvularcula sp.]
MDANVCEMPIRADIRHSGAANMTRWMASDACAHDQTSALPRIRDNPLSLSAMMQAHKSFNHEERRPAKGSDPKCGKPR